jgi:hypothetical protein
MHDHLGLSGREPLGDRVGVQSVGHDWARSHAAPHPEELDFGDVHSPTGATSTSALNHETDLEVDPRQANPHEPDKSD